MKNKRRKAAVYDPYMDTMGGGEQYVLSVLKALEDEDYDVTLFWKDDPQRQINEKFGITYKGLRVDPSGFHKDKNSLSRWWNLGDYDVFFYITDGSYFFSGAKKNFIYAMVPRKDIYQMQGMNKFKLAGWKFIANSKFTASHLKKWGLDPQVHYPCLPNDLMRSKQAGKEHIILNVGRFFGHLHKKNHHEIIETFNKLQKFTDFKNYRLVLAGGLRDEDREYYDSVVSLAKNNPSIELVPNIPREQLLDLYSRSAFYWHFTGMGVNADEHPEQVEHLGITPLEAMASGAVTFCYAAGGPLEIIEQGKNGFLFSTTDELIARMNGLKPGEMEDITSYATEYIKAHFSYTIFKNELKRIING